MMKKLSQQNQVKLHDMLIDMQHEFGVSVIASVCDTCGLVLGPKDGKGLAGVSHGRCQECRDREIYGFMMKTGAGAR